MGMHVELLQELPAAEATGLGAVTPDGCCALRSFGTCLSCTFTCNQSF